MPGVTIDVTIDNKQVLKLMKDIQGRMQHMKPAMNIIGTAVRKSIQQNFEEGGRPLKWKPSLRALRTGGKTLIKSKQLFNSFTIKADDKAVEVGTNKVYAAIHNFGGKIKHAERKQTIFFNKSKTGKSQFSRESKARYGMRVDRQSHTTNMPARPFMMIQAQDWPVILENLTDYILKQEAI